MIFNSKQLEEIENINDASGIFEDADDEAAGDEVGEAAMEWRRQLIEEAVESVKRAKTRPVDASITYEVHSLLFDRETRRFARVQRSVPGYLKIGYLNGGDREFGLLDVEGYLREYGAQKRLSELSLQLGLPDDDVSVRLDELGIQPLEELVVEEAPVVEAAPPPPPPPRPEPRAMSARMREVLRDDKEEKEDEEDEEVVEASDEGDGDSEADDEEIEVSGEDDDEDAPRGKKSAKPAKGMAPPKGAKGKAAAPSKAGPPQKSAPPAKAAPPQKAAAASKAQAPSKAPAPSKAAKAPPPAEKTAPKGKAAGGKGSINPIDDPNGYIRENFQELSNREMARITGLSEHTIRRKLGEWGLKRKKGD